MYVGGVFLIELVVFSLVIGLVIRLAPTVKTREQVVGIICVVSQTVARMPETSFMVRMSFCVFHSALFSAEK